MNADSLILPSVLLTILTALGLLVSRDWRWSIVILAVQYVGVFGLVVQFWPVELAGVKMIAGWIAGAVLGSAVLSTPEAWQEEERSWPSGRAFRLFAAILVLLAMSSLAPRVGTWITGVGWEVSLAALSLIGLGLLHLGMTAQPLRVTLGLLTVLAGFEILYAAVETSILVAGLLASVTLGLALAGTYLLVAPLMEERN